jgi:hypothetical protein
MLEIELLNFEYLGVENIDIYWKSDFFLNFEFRRILDFELSLNWNWEKLDFKFGCHLISGFVGNTLRDSRTNSGKQD